MCVGNGRSGLIESATRLRDWMAWIDSELSTRPRWRGERVARAPQVTRIRWGGRGGRRREKGEDREAIGDLEEEK